MKKNFLKKENERIRKNTIEYDKNNPEETKYFNHVARINAERLARKEFWEWKENKRWRFRK